MALSLSWGRSLEKGSEEGRTEEVILSSEGVAASHPRLTCVCGDVLNGVLGRQKGCLRATGEICSLGPQLVELYVECGR